MKCFEELNRAADMLNSRSNVVVYTGQCPESFCDLPASDTMNKLLPLRLCFGSESLCLFGDNFALIDKLFKITNSHTICPISNYAEPFSYRCDESLTLTAWCLQSSCGREQLLPRTEDPPSSAGNHPLTWRQIAQCSRIQKAWRILGHRVRIAVVESCCCCVTTGKSPRY